MLVVKPYSEGENPKNMVMDQQWSIMINYLPGLMIRTVNKLITLLMVAHPTNPIRRLVHPLVISVDSPHSSH